jgi:SAM-dependent methyltransferase
MRLFPNVHRRRARLLREYHGRKILDVGCGTNKLPGAVGMDRRVRQSVARDLQLDINHNLLDFPWPIQDNTFDLVHCSHVLEHLPPTHLVMREIWRVLKPGGRVFIECPHFSWVEAYRHYEHCHFFTVGSFDYFCGQKDYYGCDYRMVEREIFFDDITYVMLVGFLGKFWPRSYERHLAFIFPASSFYVMLEAVK